MRRDSGAVLELGRSGRAIVKLSAPFRIADPADGYAAIAPHVEALFEAFDLERRLWGSDWPFLALSGGITYDASLAALGRWLPDAADREIVLVRNPARLFGFAGQRMMGGSRGNGRLRVVLAGAGAISHYHLIAWSRERRAEVVAICDPDPGKARGRAGEFGIARVYARLEDALADGGA